MAAAAEGYLNYAGHLDDRVVGQVLGPDTSGRLWHVAGVEHPEGGGSRLALRPLSRVYNGATHNDVRQVA